MGRLFGVRSSTTSPQFWRRSLVHSDPLLLALATDSIDQAKAASEAAQLARARRVGRDRGVVNRSDQGPGIRLVSIRRPGATIVREADVEVFDAPADRHEALKRRQRRAPHLRRDCCQAREIR